MWKDNEVSTKNPEERIKSNLELIKNLIQNCKDISKDIGVSFDPIEELFSRDDLYEYAYEQGWSTSNC